MRHLSPSLEQRVSDLIMFIDDVTQLKTHLDESKNMPLGLVIHSKERKTILRRFRRKLDSAKPNNKTSGGDYKSIIEAVRRELLLALVHIARKPISLRQVERLLSITSAERSRWTKNGRLPVSGSAHISKGPNRITVPTYSPIGIETLLHSPESVDAWRQADRAK